jgi:hypothetical protein
MRWLLFLSRLAFICGICFLVSIALLIRSSMKANDPGIEVVEATASTVVFIGYVIGAIVVPLVNICYLVVLMVKRRLAIYVPMWLIVANLFFLLILVLYIFYFNDPYYHQR